MGYFNGNKVFQLVKTVNVPRFKHHVEMQGSYGDKDFTIYADIISTNGTNWANEGFNWDDVIDEIWDGIIVGYDNQHNNYEYMTVNDSSTPSYQASLFYDIENMYMHATADARNFEFISDTVTQIN